MRPWLRFQTPSASRTGYANILSEHGAGSGKKNDGAQGFHLRHGLSPYGYREKITVWERGSAISNECDIRCFRLGKKDRANRAQIERRFAKDAGAR
jgi:hypothetical protein